MPKLDVKRICTLRQCVSSFHQRDQWILRPEGEHAICLSSVSRYMVVDGDSRVELSQLTHPVQLLHLNTPMLDGRSRASMSILKCCSSAQQQCREDSSQATTQCCSHLRKIKRVTYISMWCWVHSTSGFESYDTAGNSSQFMTLLAAVRHATLIDYMSYVTQLAWATTCIITKSWYWILLH